MGAMPAPTPTVVVGFDLDLTLVDSRERIMSSYLRALHDVGPRSPARTSSRTWASR